MGLGKVFPGGPTDPEQGKAAVGVGFLRLEGLNLYPEPKPIKDYCDAEATWRCKIVCLGMAGVTCAIALICGWTGAKNGSVGTARTDDLLTIIQMQFETMEAGPKAIVGDLNGTIDAFSTMQGMLKEKGWTDIGNDSAKCHGKPGQPTCQSNGEVKESRIDYCFANDRLTPAITSCVVDQSGDFPTHRSLLIEINTVELENVTRQLQRPTNFAKLFEDKVQEETKKAEEEAVKKASEDNDDEVKGVDQHAIRKSHLNELHTQMGKQINNRFSRLRLAVMTKETTRQWDLIAAAVEEAIIAFFELTERAAKKMRGRSKITFKQTSRNVLNGIEEDEENAEAATRAEWLRKAAGEHTRMGNKLINVARRIKTMARNKDNTEKNEADAKLNAITCEAYNNLAEEVGKSKQLSEQQKNRSAWIGTKPSREKRKLKQPQTDSDQITEKHVAEVQLHAKEVQEMLQEFGTCDLSNIIHAAK